LNRTAWNSGTIWQRALTLIKESSEATLVIAGVFIFLPTLALTYFLPFPDISKISESEVIAQTINAYVQQNIWSLMLLNLIASFGGLALIFVLLGSGRTVADSLKQAALVFPFYVLASVITNLAVFVGLQLLIIPGLYLFARFLLVPVVFAREKQRSPVAVILRSWEITRKNGLRIALFLAVILFGGIFITSLSTALTNLAGGLLSPESGVPFLEMLMVGAVIAALAILYAAATAAIYEELCDPSAKPI